MRASKQLPVGDRERGGLLPAHTSPLRGPGKTHPAAVKKGAAAGDFPEWTARESEQAREMKAEGWTYASIGAAIGRNSEDVRQHLGGRPKVKNKWKPTGRKRGEHRRPAAIVTVSAEQLPKAVKHQLIKRALARDPDEGLYDIAAEFGVKLVTVSLLLAQWMHEYRAGNLASVKERKCLRCSELFMSAHSGNRICAECAPVVASDSAVTEYGLAE